MPALNIYSCMVSTPLTGSIRYHVLKPISNQLDRDPAAEAQPNEHQVKGFPGHPLPGRAEKPGKIVTEEASWSSAGLTTPPCH